MNNNRNINEVEEEKKITKKKFWDVSIMKFLRYHNFIR